ncbi:MULTISPECIES: TraQ conjugal transfer family protein [Bacteroidales]|uniref:DUF3872 domain-containing protein n=1 Tax=Prevotella heparinolytica TaxID=28113 RepID=A0A3P2AAN3_9BACE|nr:MULTISPECIES: TraQ conjugal transfer family protein [Bacteroidales]KGL47543.1 conjugal transfer protein [Porphyromonas gulae]KGL49043.1 conjugal transfer protein [Porphyromonas cangingivalis]RRD92474.1 DUF3872 domain-containing protein [Bacteroides heparinolyticus]
MKTTILSAIRMFGVLSLSMILLSSCNRDLDVQNVFPFEVHTMPFPMSLEEGETIEVRTTLKPFRQFDQTTYTLRYFQYEGKGFLRIGRGGKALVPNDRYPIKEGDFRLYYTSQGAERHQLELVFEDNHGQSRTIKLNFNHKEKKSDR